MSKAKTHRKHTAKKSHAVFTAAAKRAATKVAAFVREVKALKLKLKKTEVAHRKAHAEHKKLVAAAHKAAKAPAKKVAKKKTHHKKTHHKKVHHKKVHHHTPA